MKGIVSRLFFSAFFIMVMVGVIAESMASDQDAVQKDVATLSANADSATSHPR